MVGLISSIEKHSAACAPADYTPITLLSYIYRTWGSVRSRQCLQWMADHSPSGLAGNRPGYSTASLWYDLMLQIEDCLYQSCVLTGVVTDGTKGFNTLPRPVVSAMARTIGFPAWFVHPWHAAVGAIRRRFTIDGLVSESVQSRTGYPERDLMSVVSTGGFMRAQMSANVTHGNVFSYVDNGEIHAKDAAQAMHLKPCWNFRPW